MGDSWSRGWALLVHSLNVFRVYPSLLVPVLAVWLVYAPTIIYFKFGYAWKLHSAGENAGVVLLCIAALSYALLFSCDVVLHMVRQLEQGHPSIAKAVETAVSRDALRLVPLAMAWACIWFALTVLEALLSKRRDEADADTELTAQSAAAAIAGYGEISFSVVFIEALKKGVRMVMFLLIPAIAWENLGVVEASKKGLAVLKAHLGDFGRGYALTYAAALVAFLPAAILLELGTGRHGHPPIVVFPEAVWIGIIIYIGLVWSLCIYLEQLFMAQLYLWHLAWERADRQAAAKGEDEPRITEVPRPELLARTPGLFA